MGRSAHDGPGAVGRQEQVDGTAGPRGRPGLPRRAPTAPLGQTLGEAVFRTGMTGYQETLTDPSPTTARSSCRPRRRSATPAGTTRTTSRRAIQVAGYVVRDPSRTPSNWRSRRSARRRAGARRGSSASGGDRHPRAGPAPARAGRDAGRRVLRLTRTGAAGRRAGRPGARRARRCSARTSTAPSPRRASTSCPPTAQTRGSGSRRWTSGSSPTRRGCSPRAASRPTCCPRTRTIERDRGAGPGRVLPVQRPGDPATADVPVALTRQVLERRIPLFGICFGNQILARALGRGTYKLRYGHRGHQHPGRSSTPPAGWRSPRRTTGSPSRARRGSGSTRPFGPARDHPHLPERRLRRGPARAGRARRSACSTTPRRRPGPHDAADLFDRFVDARWAGSR